MLSRNEKIQAAGVAAMFLAAGAIVVSHEYYKRLTQFDRMSLTSLGEPPSLLFLKTATSPDRITCTMYANAAPLDYRDPLLPDPNLMTIACAENGTNFVVVKTFEGLGPEGNEQVFQDIVSSLPNR